MIPKIGVPKIQPINLTVDIKLNPSLCSQTKSNYKLKGNQQKVNTKKIYEQERKIFSIHIPKNNID